MGLLLPVRSLSSVLLGVLFLGLAARAARAEELFVLDNGSVLRGVVVRDTPKEVVVRLSGFGRDAQVTVDRKKIVQRYVTEIPDAPPPQWRPEARVPEVAAVPVAVPEDRSEDVPVTRDVVEPAAAEEGFFERMARVTVLGMPRDVSGRVTLLVLLLGALFAVVGMGGRMAEIETLNFGRTLVLAAVLGAMLTADMFLRNELLRADRAGWVLPLQGVAWLTAAGITLRENLAKLILLFAFVLFSLALLVFVAGAILVTY